MAQLSEEGHFPLRAAKIGDVLQEFIFHLPANQTMARKRKMEIWRQTASEFLTDEMIPLTNPGDIRNGKLTIFVNGSSTILQELNLRKMELLQRWNSLQDDIPIRGFTFRQGKFGNK